MKRFLFSALSAIGTLILGVLSSALWDYYKQNTLFHSLSGMVIVTILMLCLIIGVLIYIFFPVLSSYFRMYKIGKFRGLWSKDDLENLILDKYKSSDEIKIKVTRGFNLFNEESGTFYKCIFKNSGGNPKSKTLKVLLHYPCLKASHLERRATANQKNVNGYIEDLFKVLKKLKEHNALSNTVEKIFVKFYTTDEDREWRYYIFKKEDGSKTLFFNHYNDSSTGAKSRMLKVDSGKDSLCDGLDKEFDSLYENSVELISNNRNNLNLLNENFCTHPGCRDKIKEIHKKIFLDK